MSNQTRTLFIVTLAVLFAVPVDALAGGFRLFRRCRHKQTTCCPPPTCPPCAQVTCQPLCPPTPCEPITANAGPSSELKVPETKTVLAMGYYAVGSGEDSNGNFCSYKGVGCHANPQDAIDEVANSGACAGFFSYSLYPCERRIAGPEGPQPVEAENRQIDANASDKKLVKDWSLYVWLLDGRKVKRVKIKEKDYDSARQAAGEARVYTVPADKQVLFFHVIKE